MPNPIQMQRVIYPGAGGVVPFVGVLDGFPPDMAWSHRRALVSSFNASPLQGRRTSDDEPIDVGLLASREIDEAGLLSFAGAGSVAVAKLTEQINGYDLLQTTADSQRMLVDAGSLVTVGGKAASRGISNASDSVGIGGGMQTNTFPAYNGTTLSVFLRGHHASYAGSIFGAYADVHFAMTKDGGGPNDNGTFWLYRNPGGDSDNSMQIAGNYTGYAVGACDVDYLLSVIFDGTNVTLRDGTHTYSAAYTLNLDFNRFLLGLFQADGQQAFAASANRVQEMAVWLSDQTANEAAIRSALMA